jgi:hypothetical protein
MAAIGLEEAQNAVLNFMTHQDIGVSRMDQIPWYLLVPKAVYHTAIAYALGGSVHKSAEGAGFFAFTTTRTCVWNAAPLRVQLFYWRAFNLQIKSSEEVDCYWKQYRGINDATSAEKQFKICSDIFSLVAEATGVSVACRGDSKAFKSFEYGLKCMIAQEEGIPVVDVDGPKHGQTVVVTSSALVLSGAGGGAGDLGNGPPPAIGGYQLMHREPVERVSGGTLAEHLRLLHAHFDPAAVQQPGNNDKAVVSYAGGGPVPLIEGEVAFSLGTASVLHNELQLFGSVLKREIADQMRAVEEKLAESVRVLSEKVLVQEAVIHEMRAAEERNGRGIRAIAGEALVAVRIGLLPRSVVMELLHQNGLSDGTTLPSPTGSRTDRELMANLIGGIYNECVKGKDDKKSGVIQGSEATDVEFDIFWKTLFLKSVSRVTFTQQTANSNYGASKGTSSRAVKYNSLVITLHFIDHKNGENSINAYVARACFGSGGNNKQMLGNITRLSRDMKVRQMAVSVQVLNTKSQTSVQMTSKGAFDVEGMGFVQADGGSSRKRSASAISGVK